MTPALFLSVLGMHLLAAISPGPSFVVAVRTAVTEGFRPAAGLAAGFGLGAAIWAVAALAGLAFVFQVAPALLAALKLAGAAFLIFLAVRMWRHARDPLPAPVPGTPPRGGLSALRLGLATQLANPKPAVFFGAVFVGLVPHDTPPAVLALLLGLIFVNETLWYVVVARVFSAGPLRAGFGRAKHWIDRVFAGCLAAFGARIATA